MANKNFKVKNGLDVGGAINATSMSLDSDLLVGGNITISGTITGDGSGLSGVTAYTVDDFDSDFSNKTTDDLTEGSNNLFYDSDRTVTTARQSISASGDITYNPTTGVINAVIPEGYTSSDFDSDLGTKTTSDVAEGSNLYYTTERADSDARHAISVGGDLSYNVQSGVISATLYTTTDFENDIGNTTTDDLSEGSINKYYTTSRTDSDAKNAISGGTGVDYNSTTGEISIGQSVGTTDDVTFNSVTGTSLLTSGNVTASDLNTNYVDLTVDSDNPSHQEGRVFYDMNNHTLAVYNDVSDVTHQLGQEVHIRVYNNTGYVIPNGSVVSFSNSSVNGIPTIQLADASDINKVINIAGITTHNISDASEGIVTRFGSVNGVDTSTLSLGPVYVSASTPGAITNTPPTYPNYPVQIGGILSVDSDGSIGVDFLKLISNLRIPEDARIDGNLTVGGNFNVLGTQTTTAISNLEVSDNFIFVGAGDTIDGNAVFLGTGLDDVYISGHYRGETSYTAYVKIDGVGTPNTYKWAKNPSFNPSEASNVNITPGTPQLLENGLYIDFASDTGHTLGDIWTFDVAPVNVQFGIIGNYNTPTEPYSNAGMFRDIADSRFKFFQGLTSDVEGFVDTADSSFELAPIQFSTAYGQLVGSVTGNVTGNASSATILQTSRAFSMSGDVAAPSISFNGNGNVSLVSTIQPLAVENSMLNGGITYDKLAGSIPDTKLNTITTTGKVANSATTANSANTASSIVARDVSGSFSANIITASSFVGDGSQLTGVTSYTQTDFDNDFAEKTTNDLSEGTSNLYFTNTRARSAISASGSLSYNSTTGVISYTQRTDAQIRSLFSASGDLSYNTTTGVFSITSPEGYSTTDLNTDITTNSTVQGNIRGLIGVSGDLSYNSTTGILSATTYKTTNFNTDFSNKSTTDLSEGTNLYFTNARARSALSVTDAGGAGSIVYNSGTGVLTYTGPSSSEIRTQISASGDISYNNTTGVISFSETYSTPAELLAAIKTVDVNGTSGLNAGTLDGQPASYYRINVYNNTGTLLN